MVSNGGSTSIAIVDAYDNPGAAKDLAKFSKQFGLPHLQTSGQYSPPARGHFVIRDVKSKSRSMFNGHMRWLPMPNCIFSTARASFLRSYRRPIERDQWLASHTGR